MANGIASSLGLLEEEFSILVRALPAPGCRPCGGLRSLANHILQRRIDTTTPLVCDISTHRKAPHGFDEAFIAGLDKIVRDELLEAEWKWIDISRRKTPHNFDEAAVIARANAIDTWVDKIVRGEILDAEWIDGIKRCAADRLSEPSLCAERDAATNRPRMQQAAVDHAVWKFANRQKMTAKEIAANITEITPGLLCGDDQVKRAPAWEELTKKWGTSRKHKTKKLIRSSTPPPDFDLSDIGSLKDLEGR